MPARPRHAGPAPRGGLTWHAVLGAAALLCSALVALSVPTSDIELHTPAGSATAGGAQAPSGTP